MRKLLFGVAGLALVGLVGCGSAEESFYAQGSNAVARDCWVLYIYDPNFSPEQYAQNLTELIAQIRDFSSEGAKQQYRANVEVTCRQGAADIAQPIPPLPEPMSFDEALQKASGRTW